MFEQLHPSPWGTRNKPWFAGCQQTDIEWMKPIYILVRGNGVDHPILIKSLG